MLEKRLLEKIIVLGDTLIAQGKIEEGLQIFNIAIDFNPAFEYYTDRGI